MGIKIKTKAGLRTWSWSGLMTQPHVSPSILVAWSVHRDPCWSKSAIFLSNICILEISVKVNSLKVVLISRTPEEGDRNVQEEDFHQHLCLSNEPFPVFIFGIIQPMVTSTSSFYFWSSSAQWMLDMVTILIAGESRRTHYLIKFIYLNSTKNLNNDIALWLVHDVSRTPNDEHDYMVTFLIYIYC